MRFISVTIVSGDEAIVNVEKISHVFSLSRISGGTRILFNYEATGDCAYIDVKESVSQILSRLQ